MESSETRRLNSSAGMISHLHWPPEAPNDEYDNRRKVFITAFLSLYAEETFWKHEPFGNLCGMDQELVQGWKQPYKGTSPTILHNS